MPRDAQELLWLIEDRLSTISRWLAARRVAGEQRLERLRAHVEARQRERWQETEQSAHDAVARARAALEETEREDQVPPRHGPLRREELHALRRHLQVTATLLPRVSNLDDPAWKAAHEEYERSWEEVRRPLEAEDGAAAPR